MALDSFHIGQASPAKIVVQKNSNPRFNFRNPLVSLNEWVIQLTPIKDQEKATFFRLMATMVNAGISITKALKILKTQMKNKHFQLIIQKVNDSVEGGGSFSEALSEFNRYFGEAQIGMLEAGEATGRLNQTMLQIASETEKSSQLNKKIKGAMVYPATIILILMGAMYAVMTFVIPEIKGVFDSLGANLPPLTQLLISVSDYIVGQTFGFPNAILVLLMLAGLFVGFVFWKRTLAGRLIWSSITLKIPIFGDLSKKVVLARFCRSLSMLIASGVPIVKSLYITANSVDHPLYEKRIRLVADDVKKGITMGENMKDDERYFPPMVAGMISIAEQTAQLDQISEKLANFYEDEVSDIIKNLSSLIEPLIIVILGGAVAFLVIAVMLPILQSSDLALL
ncbi:type II secretion system F family protein [Candidatus Peregrinibacteria bacterium]|nr:MAG: type II secretion system F family protein [Candidatus Peregrinibacteria bacterium]